MCFGQFLTVTFTMVLVSITTFTYQSCRTPREEHLHIPLVITNGSELTSVSNATVAVYDLPALRPLVKTTVSLRTVPLNGPRGPWGRAMDSLGPAPVSLMVRV